MIGSLVAFAGVANPAHRLLMRKISVMMQPYYVHSGHFTGHFVGPDSIFSTVLPIDHIVLICTSGNYHRGIGRQI